MVLSQISTLNDIETIELGYGYTVSGAGLEHLKSMKKLKTLYLYRTGLKHLAKLLLSNIRTTPRVLDSLIQHQLPGLRKMTLEGPEVNDELVKCIHQLSLRRLAINRSEISGEVLRQLAEMQSLEDLDLRNNNALTDAGMIHLELLKQLQCLKIGYRGATPEGVTRFTPNARSLEFILRCE